MSELWLGYVERMLEFAFFCISYLLSLLEFVCLLKESISSHFCEFKMCICVVMQYFAFFCVSLYRILQKKHDDKPMLISKMTFEKPNVKKQIQDYMKTTKKYFRHTPDMLPTYSRHMPDILPTDSRHTPDILPTYSRHTPDIPLTQSAQTLSTSKNAL